MYVYPHPMQAGWTAADSPTPASPSPLPHPSRTEWRQRKHHRVRWRRHVDERGELFPSTPTRNWERFLDWGCRQAKKKKKKKKKKKNVLTSKRGCCRGATRQLTSEKQGLHIKIFAILYNRFGVDNIFRKASITVTASTPGSQGPTPIFLSHSVYGSPSPLSPISGNVGSDPDDISSVFPYILF